MLAHVSIISEARNSSCFIIVPCGWSLQLEMSCEKKLTVLCPFHNYHLLALYEEILNPFQSLLSKIMTSNYKIQWDQNKKCVYIYNIYTDKYICIYTLFSMFWTLVLHLNLLSLLCFLKMKPKILTYSLDCWSCRIIPNTATTAIINLPSKL